MAEQNANTLPHRSDRCGKFKCAGLLLSGNDLLRVESFYRVFDAPGVRELRKDYASAPAPDQV